jgi:hypothetical protein
MSNPLMTADLTTLSSNLKSLIDGHFIDFCADALALCANKHA